MLALHATCSELVLARAFVVVARSEVELLWQSLEMLRMKAALEIVERGRGGCARALPWAWTWLP